VLQPPIALFSLAATSREADHQPGCGQRSQAAMHSTRGQPEASFQVPRDEFLVSHGDLRGHRQQVAVPEERLGS